MFPISIAEIVKTEILFIFTKVRRALPAEALAKVGTLTRHTGQATFSYMNVAKIPHLAG